MSAIKSGEEELLILLDQDFLLDVDEQVKRRS